MNDITRTFIALFLTVVVGVFADILGTIVGFYFGSDGFEQAEDRAESLQRLSESSTAK